MNKKVYQELIELLGGSSYHGEIESIDEDIVELSIDELTGLAEDCIGEIERLKEEIERIEHDRDCNYRPMTVAEQVDYNSRDFY